MKHEVWKIGRFIAVLFLRLRSRSPIERQGRLAGADLNGARFACPWPLGDNVAGEAVFQKLLLLNPTDNQGARFNLAAIEAAGCGRNGAGTTTIREDG